MVRDDLNAPIRDLEDAVTRVYPPPVKEPCRECPWRRASWAGHLGPFSPEEWLDILHGESPIACHLTIPPGGGWGDNTRQCRGAAIMRANVCKTPRNPSIETGPEDPVTVFRRNAEFLEHHG